MNGLLLPVNSEVSLSVGLTCFGERVNWAPFDCLAQEHPEVGAFFPGISEYGDCAAFDSRQIEVPVLLLPLQGLGHLV